MFFFGESSLCFAKQLFVKCRKSGHASLKSWSNTGGVLAVMCKTPVGLALKRSSHSLLNDAPGQSSLFFVKQLFVKWRKSGHASLKSWGGVLAVMSKTPDKKVDLAHKWSNHSLVNDALGSFKIKQTSRYRDKAENSSRKSAHHGFVFEGRGSQLYCMMLLLLSCLSLASGGDMRSSRDPLLYSDTSWVPSVCKGDVSAQASAIPLASTVIKSRSTPTSWAGVCFSPLTLEQVPSICPQDDTSWVSTNVSIQPAASPFSATMSRWPATLAKVRRRNPFYLEQACCAPDVCPLGNISRSDTSWDACIGVGISITSTSFSNTSYSNASLAVRHTDKPYRQHLCPSWAKHANVTLPLHSGGVYPLLFLDVPFLLHFIAALALCLYIKLRYPLHYVGRVTGLELQPERTDPEAGWPIQETCPDANSEYVCNSGPSQESFLRKLHHLYSKNVDVQLLPTVEDCEDDDLSFSTTFAPPSSVDHDSNPLSVSASSKPQAPKARRAATVEAQREEIVAPEKAPGTIDVVVPTSSRKQPTGVPILGPVTGDVTVLFYTHSSDSDLDSKASCDETVTVSSKITADGHRANASISKLKVMQEPSVLALCVPNPPPNMSGICLPPPCVTQAVETAVGFMGVNGFGVHLSCMGPSCSNDHLEFHPAISDPQPMGVAYDALDEPFSCCFDRGIIQIFRGQYGPN